MSLLRKLARLRSAGPGGKAPDAADADAVEPAERPVVGAIPERPGDTERRARIASMRRQLDAMVSTGRVDAKLRAEAMPRVDEPLPGELTVTAHGEVQMVDTWLEPHHCHGEVPVRSALDVKRETVAQLALDPGLAAVDYRRILLIDTETTGLAGGAGTIPFLIGMAWFEDDSLRVQQLLLRRLGEEAPMLRVLADRIREASCIVSYNGKSFDWPLLRTRFVMNRVAAPELPPHLDLLHCSRRVFKQRLDSVRLVDMERELLRMYREDDVPGSEIPAIYLSFLKGRGVGRLPGVIEHNGHDLVALAAILGRLTWHFENVRPRDDPRDHLAYARVAHRAGDVDKAKAFATAAADGGGDAGCTVAALLLTGRIARKAKDVEAERRALERALTDAEAGSALAAAALEAAVLEAEVRLELAKLFEHRVKCLASALEHARETGPAEGDEASAHRVSRLERRVARQAGL